MKTKHKDEILRLRAEGKTYDEIREITGASKGTISYHCGKGQKEKNQNRQIKRRGLIHPFQRKIEKFSYEKQNLNMKTRAITENKIRIYSKVHSFQNNKNNIKEEKMLFTLEDVLAKFGENPKCYLTGDYIDINNPDTYHFDHIIPASKGGTNTLDNLGICTKEANMSKTDHTLEEFYLLCEKVLKVRDSKK